jgi:hypothetical protein
MVHVTLAVLIGTLCSGANAPWQPPIGQRPATGNGQQTPTTTSGPDLAVEVVLEQVDVAAGTVTATACDFVIPPKGSAGGAVFVGHQREKATRFERLPVMSEAKLDSRGLRTGDRVILRLGVVSRGALAVVGMEQASAIERIGVEWLDAPSAGPKDR